MKTAIIGAGNVGATCAMRLLEAGLCDVVLLDVVESIAKGKAEDLMDAASLIGHDRTILGTSNYADIAGSDIVIIAAGFARKPGMDREELLNKNASVVRDVAKQVVSHTKKPIIIVVTNPLDVMAYLVFRESGLSRKRVFGMAGVLDSSRMNLMAARTIKKPLKTIQTLVLGTHGETMVPVVSQSKIGNNDISDSTTEENLAEILKRTKSRGAEIVSYFGTGSAFYAPSAGVLKMVKAIIENTNEILPCSCFLQGEYGIKDVYLGVPAVIGSGGVDKIVELSLTEDEAKQLKAAAESVRAQISTLTL